VVYAELIQRAVASADSGKEGAAEAAVQELNHKLKTKRWRVSPEDIDPYADAVVEEGAPWWWDGSEEASDSFLDTMGVQLD
jgi:hypothetical protein